jgi:hypothetical protein
MALPPRRAGRDARAPGQGAERLLSPPFSGAVEEEYLPDLRHSSNIP